MTLPGLESRVVTAHAHAKVNYSLDVGGLRSDGYHEVRTVLQTISLADIVEVRWTGRQGVELTVLEGNAPAGEANLVWRAADSYLRRMNMSDVGVSLRLIKRIPAQAGLGGGSSDAAATLLALNELAGQPLSPEELHPLASALGSDVPFFLYGGTACMEGRGEVLKPAPPSPPLHFVIVKPPCGVATAAAYQALDGLAGRRMGTATDAVLMALDRQERNALAVAMGNDFEEVLPALCPMAVRAMAELTAAGAQTVHLCGSGSAVFGVVESRSHSEEIVQALRPHWQEVYACTTVPAT